MLEHSCCRLQRQKLIPWFDIRLRGSWAPLQKSTSKMANGLNYPASYNKLLRARKKKNEQLEYIYCSAFSRQWEKALVPSSKISSHCSAERLEILRVWK